MSEKRFYGQNYFIFDAKTSTEYDYEPPFQYNIVKLLNNLNEEIENLLRDNRKLKQQIEKLQNYLQRVADWIIRDCGTEYSKCEFKTLECPNSDEVSCELADEYHNIINLLKELKKNE